MNLSLFHDPKIFKLHINLESLSQSSLKFVEIPISFTLLLCLEGRFQNIKKG